MPVGGDLLHRGLAEADVRDRLRRVERFTNGGGYTLQGLFVERGITVDAGQADGVEQALGFEIEDRRVVLVKAADDDALRRGAGGFSKDGAPALVGIVADLAPVHAHDDDGLLALRRQYQALGEQGIDDRACGFDHPRE